MNVHALIALAMAALIGYMLRRAGVLSVLFAVLFGSIALADFPIARKHFVPNQAPGFCVWCSLETLGAQHGIRNLRGVADYYKRHDKRGMGASPEEVIAALDSLQVRYHMSEQLEPEVLRSVSNQQIGAVVTLRDYPVRGWSHAVILTEYGPTVRWRDVNHPEWSYSHNREWFDTKVVWAVVIEP